MQTVSPELSFLSFFALISFFIFLIIQKYSSKLFNSKLLDVDYNKPQSFHEEAIPRSGGVAGIICFILSLIIYKTLFFEIPNDYLVISIGLFLVGFIDDLKISISPNKRLLLMSIILIISIIFFSLSIEAVDFIFLSNLLESKVFSTLFLLFCFLFIINGANLIDGFNGLLAIHLIIINFILLLININYQNENLTFIIAAQIIILFSFLLFNFPKAKIFFGDSGAYLFGSLAALNVIQTNNYVNEISSFFFCILLFYLFLEVFFSFFRKLLNNQSPFKPDNKHLHMLIYNYLKIRFNFKNLNSINSILINLSYLLIISPAIFFNHNGIFCRYWFLITLVIYFLFYSRISSFLKNRIDI